jgi:hypothetical protein
LSIIGTKFGHPQGVIGRATGQRVLRTLMSESLRALLIGLVGLEPMAAACLSQTEVQSAAADAAYGRG